MNIFDAVLNLVLQMNLYAHIVLHRVFRWLRQNVLYMTSGAFLGHGKGARGILIIGDVLAEGIGDTVAEGGIAIRLNHLLRKPSSQSNLFLNWTAVSVGKLHTTSQDWLPVVKINANASLPRNETPSKNGSLFSNALLTGLFRRADILVVFLGAHDRLADAEDTVRNIADIADAAARLGKQVLVGNIPNFEDDSADGRKAGHARNKALEAALARATAHKYDSGSVTLGIDTEKILARGQDILREERNFVTLNSFGYRTLAADVLEAVVPVAKRIEWSYFKERLAPSLVRASSGH